MKTAPAMQWEVARAMRAAVRRALEEAGIPLGGQRDLLAAYRAQLDAAVRVPDEEVGAAGAAEATGEGGATGRPAPVTDTRRESDSLDTTAPPADPGRGGR